MSCEISCSGSLHSVFAKRLWNNNVVWFGQPSNHAVWLNVGGTFFCSNLSWGCAWDFHQWFANTNISWNPVLNVVWLCVFFRAKFLGAKNVVHSCLVAVPFCTGCWWNHTLWVKLSLFCDLYLFPSSSFPPLLSKSSPPFLIFAHSPPAPLFGADYLGPLKLGGRKPIEACKTHLAHGSLKAHACGNNLEISKQIRYTHSVCLPLRIARVSQTRNLIRARKSCIRYDIHDLGTECLAP